MLDQLVSDLGVDLSKSLMVGDRLNTDIEFGNQGCGSTLLVLTGVTQEASLDALPSAEQTPGQYASSVATLLKGLEGVKPSSE